MAAADAALSAAAEFVARSRFISDREELRLLYERADKAELNRLLAENRRKLERRAIG